MSFALGGVLVPSFARFATKAFLYLRSPYSRDPGDRYVLAMIQFLDERGNYFLRHARRPAARPPESRRRAGRPIVIYGILSPVAGPSPDASEPHDAQEK